MPTTLSDAVQGSNAFQVDQSIDETLSVAQRSQQMIEESIQRNPGLYVGVALAAGVVLGCFIKRN